MTPPLLHEYTFQNVTITIIASNPETAYLRLCEQLTTSDLEYQTDTWITDADPETEHSTVELWPQ